MRIISIFAGLGVNKVRFTGGEPTVSSELSQLIAHSRLQPNIHSVGITTNGVILSRHLDRLLESGLSSVNISLDTLDSCKYEEITRRDRRNFDRVLSSIYGALGKKLKVKVNCVVMRGINDGNTFIVAFSRTCFPALVLPDE